jgi:hypothetical protein
VAMRCSSDPEMYPGGIADPGQRRHPWPAASRIAELRPGGERLRRRPLPGRVGGTGPLPAPGRDRARSVSRGSLRLSIWQPCGPTARGGHGCRARSSSSAARTSGLSPSRTATSPNLRTGCQIISSSSAQCCSAWWSPARRASRAFSGSEAWNTEIDLEKLTVRSRYSGEIRALLAASIRSSARRSLVACGSAASNWSRDLVIGAVVLTDKSV